MGKSSDSPVPLHEEPCDCDDQLNSVYSQDNVVKLISYEYNSALSKPHYHSARKKCATSWSASNVSNYFLILSRYITFVILCLILVHDVLGAGKELTFILFYFILNAYRIYFRVDAVYMHICFCPWHPPSSVFFYIHVIFLIAYKCSLDSRSCVIISIFFGLLFCVCLRVKYCISCKVVQQSYKNVFFCFVMLMG